MKALQSEQFQVVVKRKSIVADGIACFELEQVSGLPMHPNEPGAHIDVHLPNGMTRQYSLLNKPGEISSYRIALQRDGLGRGGSVEMHDKVFEGDLLQISEPKNHFPLDESASRSLLLAGGIGITPLLAMAQHLASNNADFTLHYCTRSKARTAFADVLKGPGLLNSVCIHHDDEPPTQQFDILKCLASESSNCHLYVCGPAGFMESVLRQARSLNWPEERIHYEYFSNSNSVSRKESSFEIVVKSTGMVVNVLAGQTALEALSLQGISIPTSCEQGVCGTCLTGVLAGEPDHRDLYLTPDERARNDQFLPCCSRAISDQLILDL